MVDVVVEKTTVVSAKTLIKGAERQSEQKTQS